MDALICSVFVVDFRHPKLDDKLMFEDSIHTSSYSSIIFSGTIYRIYRIVLEKV